MFYIIQWHDQNTGERGLFTDHYHGHERQVFDKATVTELLAELRGKFGHGDSATVRFEVFKIEPVYF